MKVIIYYYYKILILKHKLLEKNVLYKIIYLFNLPKKE